MDELKELVRRAFREAEARGRSAAECYLAAVAVWRERYPEHSPAYAAQCATTIVLEWRSRTMLTRLVRDQADSTPVRKTRRPRPAVGARVERSRDSDVDILDDAAVGAQPA